MKQRHGFELLIVILVAMGLAVIDCSDPKGSPVGSDFLGRELLDVVGPVWIPLQSAQAVQDTSQSNDKGSLLYVYRDDETDHQVQSVILFAPPDSGTVQEATLKLIQDSVSVTGANIIAVYEWTQTWQDAVDAGNPLETAPLGLRLADVSIETTEEDTLTIALDPTWIQSWTDTCGFILVSEISNLTASFYSNDNTYSSPTLNLLMDSDTTETVRYPVKDRFVVSRPQSATETAFTIDNGTSQRIRLTFDVSAFAENATLNMARLRLFVDPEVISPLPDATFNIFVFPVSGDSTEVLEYDSSTYASGAVSGDSVVFEVQQLCQNWTAGLTDNLGFMIMGAGEKKAITRRTIFTTSGDEKRNPKLEVYYTPSAVAPENP